jgi:hypothetical protein
MNQAGGDDAMPRCRRGCRSRCSGLKMPRISPLRRMRRPSHTARVVIGVYSAESTLSRSCLVFRDGGTTARARRASESHTRGRDQPGSVPAELA